MRQYTNGSTCAVGKLCLHFVAGKRMAHVGIEPLFEDISGDFRVVVLWSVVAGSLPSLGFVLRCRRPLFACICAFRVGRDADNVSLLEHLLRGIVAEYSPQYTARCTMVRGTVQLQIMLHAWV